MGRQIFHPSILLAYIRRQPSIGSSRHLGSYSIRGVLGNCSGTFPSFSTGHVSYGSIHGLLMLIQVAVTAYYCFFYSLEETLPAEELFSKNLIWLYVGSWVPHIFIDLVLLGLPVPLLWKLQMRITQKLILTAVFACGGVYVAPLLFQLRIPYADYTQNQDLSLIKISRPASQSSLLSA